MTKKTKIITRIVGAFVTFLLLLAGTFYLLTFAGTQSIKVGPPLDARLSKVIDGIAAIYLVDLGNGQLALIDAGNDDKGQELLKALDARHKKPEDVTAIFLTHSHSDHIGAVGLFPKATLYAGQAEVALAAGKQAYSSPFTKVYGKFNAKPFTVSHPLTDGEKVQLGDTTITAFSIPSHTPGSTAYLVNGALFIGDSGNFKANGVLAGPWWIFTQDVAQGLASLRALGARLQKENMPVAAIVTAHTGAGGSVGALLTIGQNP